MQHIVRTLAVALLAAATLATFEQARDSITSEEIRAHLFLLSSDRLEGRGPGTRGADIAAEYIAGRFMAMGLQPMADGSYLQDVPVTGTTVDPTTVSLAFESNDRRVPASYPSSAVIWPGAPHPSIHVAGELVFVGYGIDAPEWGWDDYKGRDLNGKVLLFLVGDPPSPPDEPDLFDGRSLTYYGRWSYKLEEARRRGATGALIIHRPDAAGYGWSVVESSWTGEQLAVDQEGDGPRLMLQGWVTSELARTAIETAGLDIDELTVSAARRDFRPIATGVTVRSRMNSRSRAIRASNVVGFVPGRTDEVVVFTSHYDHLGIGRPVEGDSIYNGAYDNASGVSVLLELADAFRRLDRPGRGALFIATTGEEAGLLGARHYVANPVVPLARTVAAINIDGVNLWGETDDVIALGAGYSTLGTVLEPRASEMGLRVRPDPAPATGSFFRSDHFPFALAGVPALYIQHGLEFRGRPAGWGDSLMVAWRREHYHQPSDEYDPAADLSGAVQQARLVFGVAFDLATSEERPVWLEGAPFAYPRDPASP